MKDERKYLLYFWLCATVFIFTQIFYSPHGYVTPDSGNYLRLAKNLSEGQGMYVYNPCAPGDEEYFAKWPLGYPAVTAFVALVTRLGVFWASKVANLLLLLASMLVLHRLLKNKLIYVLPVIFIDSYLDIAKTSWSENLFIFGILLSILALKRLHEKADAWSAFLILFSTQIIFLSRYAGIVVFFYLALIAVIFLLKKQKRQFTVLSVAAVASFILCLAYLYLNYRLNGNPTGLDRGGPKADFLLLLRRTFFAVGFEMAPLEFFKGPGFWLITVPLTLLTTTSLLYYLYRRRFFLAFKNLHFNMPDVLILSGLFWWISIISFSFFLHFDPMGYRLLGPGTVLIYCGLAIELLPLISWQKQLRTAMLILPLLYTTTAVTSVDKSETFEVAEKKRIEKYSKLPDNSLVLFGDNHLHYLFERLRPMKPYQDMDVILKRFEECGVNAIYLERMPECKGIDEALPLFYQENAKIKDGEELIRLR